MHSDSDGQGDGFGTPQPTGDGADGSPFRLLRGGLDDPDAGSRTRVAGVRLVREYKGATVDELISEPDAERLAERLPRELEALLAEIEAGQLAAAERRLDERLADHVFATISAEQSEGAAAAPEPAGEPAHARARFPTAADRLVWGFVVLAAAALVAGMAWAL